MMGTEKDSVCHHILIIKEEAGREKEEKIQNSKGERVRVKLW